MVTKVALTANVLTELVTVPVSKAVFFLKKSVWTNRRRLGSYEPAAFSMWSISISRYKKITAEGSAMIST
ncbi:hypothetical protein QNH48_23680 [Neobacillus sp. YX16]|uniref:hypothetical protein n=1 Tax=Neobacillus sp. YX16 TaxID=3047874 RepID=UPI0024C35F6F|nr:hypothetical protein [Neobacillus sp. YX16]WHZ01950.1 hypothetical protein QNH48_23680 [Neobacillus sp. YX16]